MNSYTAKKNKRPGKDREEYGISVLLIFFVLALATIFLSVALGSVKIPLKDIGNIIMDFLLGKAPEGGKNVSIILSVRLPRVLCVALAGASLSLCGATMQGLLRNPLADGSTLGVSSGASLGAVIAIALGISIPSLPFAGTMIMAIIFAFISIVIILSLARVLDFSLSTTTIILLGAIYSMFVSSLITLVISFSGERVGSITFWMLGSLSGSSYTDALILFIALAVCGFVILSRAQELNAFAVGEDNALHIGVDVQSVKLSILISVSVLIGVCVSVGGSIGFVGLITPHMLRMITGPNHKKLLPASIFGGGVFLMLSDLLARLVLRPQELPVGVVTSLLGSLLFIYILYISRRGKK